RRASESFFFPRRQIALPHPKATEVFLSLDGRIRPSSDPASRTESVGRRITPDLRPNGGDAARVRGKTKRRRAPRASHAKVESNFSLKNAWPFEDVSPFPQNHVDQNGFASSRRVDP